jgi:hypothetical protein
LRLWSELLTYFSWFLPSEIFLSSAIKFFLRLIDPYRLLIQLIFENGGGFREIFLAFKSFPGESFIPF